MALIAMVVLLGVWCMSRIQIPRVYTWWFQLLGQAEVKGGSLHLSLLKGVGEFDLPAKPEPPFVARGEETPPPRQGPAKGLY